MSSGVPLARVFSHFAREKTSTKTGKNDDLIFL